MYRILSEHLTGSYQKSVYISLGFPVPNVYTKVEQEIREFSRVMFTEEVSFGPDRVLLERWDVFENYLRKGAHQA